MFERFTSSAREVVKTALHEAGELRHQYVGTEHLLLGVLGQSGGAAATVLAEVDLSAEFVRAEVVRRVGCGTDQLGEQEADALSVIGIDLDAVRARVEGLFGEGVLDQPHGGRPGGRLPFTPRAKKALELSLREAKQLGHHHLGSEHVLLGLIREADGIAGQILATKLSRRELRERLLAELDNAA